MLVTLEGLDGSGKTTAMAALRERVPAATFTREPTGSWYGESVLRSIRDDDADPLAELFLFTADHADHLSRTVRPGLDAGVVISDRFADSRYAYQAATLETYDSLAVDDALAYVREIHEPFTVVPSLTVYLDVDPETAAERAGATNKLERVSYLERVRENYERLLEEESARFVRIDATRPEDAVVADVVAAVSNALSDGS